MQSIVKKSALSSKVKNFVRDDISITFRRGSRKNVDRFTVKRAPKAQAPRGVRGHVPTENFFNFNYLKYPFLAL